MVGVGWKVEEATRGRSNVRIYSSEIVESRYGLDGKERNNNAADFGIALAEYYSSIRILIHFNSLGHFKTLMSHFLGNLLQVQRRCLL